MCPNPFKSPSPPPAPAPVAYMPPTQPESDPVKRRRKGRSLMASAQGGRGFASSLTGQAPGQSFEEFVRDIIRRQTLGS
jgi:hypothetical protein